MLQAKTKDGTLVIPAQLTRNEIDSWRQETFYCPVCQERVILKAGPRVMPHFAHYSTKNCPSAKGGEGPYHERGKLILYDWLKRQHIPVLLEPYLPSIQQQPDILITIKQKKIAIEFQCSRTSPAVIQARNSGYRRLNIEPIWILGAKLFNRQSNQSLRIDAFTKQFIQQFSPSLPLTLFYFCPTTQIFVQAQHLHLLKQSVAYVQLHSLPLSQLNFLDLFNVQSFDRRKFLQTWLRVKQNFRVKPPGNIYGRERQWYQWLYEKGTHVQYLPPFIYLPIQSQIYMKTPLWDWQSRLYLNIIQPIPIGSRFNISFCQKYFKKVMKPMNRFPLIKQLPNPIYEYLKLLETLQLIKQHDEYTFVKTQQIVSPNHIEQSIQADRELLEKLLRKDCFSYERFGN